MDPLCNCMNLGIENNRVHNFKDCCWINIIITFISTGVKKYKVIEDIMLVTRYVNSFKNPKIL